MQYKFVNIFLDKKDIMAQEKKSLNRFLLENNTEQLEKIYDFYNNDSDFLCINGFLGTGKTQIVDYSLSFVSQEAIILKYDCFESTILDDILLNFYNDFKKLSAQKIISEPKIKTENFAQKINSYFSQIEKPFLIVLNSFEAVLEENRQEILDFILHLSSYLKVKIILISKTFESEYFTKQVKYDRISVLALERTIFEKYLKSEKVKFNNSLAEEFYKNTRGYYFYTALSIRIMQNKDLSLTDFLAEFGKSFLTFDNFLKKQAFSLIPATSRNMFWFLSMLRHPISVDLLKLLNLYDAQKLEFLSENLILNTVESLVYIKGYFYDPIETPIAQNIAQKLHQYIIDLYQTQLPLKPLERNILISRPTMRKEIEYHSLFLPKRPKYIEGGAFDINYLSYAKGLEFDYSHLKPKEDKADIKQGQQSDSVAMEQIQTDLLNLSSVKNIEINLKELPFALSEEEMNLLDNIEKTAPSDKFKQEISETVSGEEDLLDLGKVLALAKIAEEAYLYQKAIDLYKNAIELEFDPTYQVQLPIIYTKIAKTYQKIADNENALKYYTLAQRLYETAKELIKANYIKLSVAKIFYDSYKFDKTRETLLDILKFEGNPAILNTKTYLQLANLEANLSNTNGAFENYKKAVEISNETMDIETLSELYFKYALVLDDKNDTKSAIEFYEKCINLSVDFKLNKFLSSAYSNIATLYLEKNQSSDDTALAVKNYLKAYEIDKQNDNYDGMYYAASKLAAALQRRHPEEALKFFNKALDCAKMLNDTFYIASASLAVGDYYYDKKQDETALQHYIFALELVKNEFSKDNIDKIKMRINDIKFRLGEERFGRLMQILSEDKIG